MWFFNKAKVVEVSKAITSPLDSIKVDIDGYSVYCNGKAIGYVQKGQINGLWFVSELGEDIHCQTIEDLKTKLETTLEKYRVFFKN